MYPYFVESEDFAVDLYQLKDGRFQPIKQGELGPFMYGDGYLLIENELAEYLELLDLPRVAFKDAVIWDRKTDSEYRTHKEVIIGQHFSFDQINDIDLDGERILMMDNMYVFVSPALKNKLEKSKFTYLKFSEGLSNFA